MTTRYCVRCKCGRFRGSRKTKREKLHAQIRRELAQPKLELEESAIDRDPRQVEMFAEVGP